MILLAYRVCQTETVHLISNDVYFFSYSHTPLVSIIIIFDE